MINFLKSLWLSPTNKPSPQRYGTFEGVFKPTLLTILGAIMYLRLGWVVGNAGLLGGLLVVLSAVSITLATGLSISSIATNNRLGDGGPYAMISKSLGLEIGGSVGVPLFVSQALAVAMYIFGFREGWLHLFPEHSPLIVDLTVFVLVFAITYISAGLAFRVQYLVLALIILSLVSIFSSSISWNISQPVTLWGSFSGSIDNNFTGITFWGVFAVFFPATTGIMSGVNMSGELKNSRQNIPLGTLSAIFVSSIIYLILCYWLSHAASPEELVNNYTIMVDKARWSSVVLVGLLAATFSAALSSLVGSPRILTALAKDGVIPCSNWLAKVARNGEPRRALGISGVIVLVALLLRNLNAIAPLITLFFLLTYATINLVVLIESSLGLMNFRPTLKLNWIIPFYGLVGCIVAMLVIKPILSLLAIGIVLAIYLRLVNLPKERRPADVRSGIFAAIAQWAATQVMQLDLTNARAWKPTLLVPVEDSSELLGEFRILLDLAQPEGSVQLLGLTCKNGLEILDQQLRELSNSFRYHKIFTTISVMKVSSKSEGIIAAVQALQNAFFRPNILFFQFPQKSDDWQEIINVFEEIRRLRVGVILLGLHPSAGLGRMEVINLWIRPQLENIPIFERLKKSSMDLAILLSLRLVRVWKAQFNLISTVTREEDKIAADNYLQSLKDLCRIPPSAKTLVIIGDFADCVTQAPQGDINFIGLQTNPNFEFVQQMIDITGSSCLFISDSGNESALA